MPWFKRKPRNRRLGQENVLEVKLHSDQVQAARMRRAVTTISVGFGTVFCLYVIWRSGEWLLKRMVYQNPSFAIRRIEVETDGVIKTAQLRRWADVREGENLMALDLAQVRRYLELSSAIRFVAVERELPDTLHIRVSEREPIAEIPVFVGAPGGGLTTAKYQLDAEGSVVKPLDPRQLEKGTNSLPAALPLIMGFKSMDIVAGRRLESPRIQAALRLIELQECSPMGGVTAFKEIDVSSPEALLAVTTDNSQVTFGTENLEQQLLRWRAVYEFGRTNGRAIASLDLSVTNNVPARWVPFDPSRPPLPARAGKPSRPKRKNV